ncbi:DUF429 domain-containing protein [Candidatus Poribacteria bacterium]|nr:DUF429 domain-containing protein [Candidatus Poribacteria bacterium]
MNVVLGIDAAWTETEPSGVAVVVRNGFGWRCVAVAPSYDSFLERARGIPVDWNTPRFGGSLPCAKELLDAAECLANAPVDIVTIDMPISTKGICGRREADNQISKKFGSRGCSAHSPGLSRPGRIGERVSDEFAAEGYPVATTLEHSGVRRRLVEVYPHPALLTLLGSRYRIQYKVSKSRRYWPDYEIRERSDALLCTFDAIRMALADKLGLEDLPLPKTGSVKTLAAIKRYEDTLDALICAWVGTLYTDGKAFPYGDTTAAIWCPREGD